MWEKVGALVAVILLVAAAVGTYYNLESRVSSLEDAKLVEWKETIKKYQGSEAKQCADIEVDFDMSHGYNQKEWCPENYFITKINLEAHNESKHGPVSREENNQWTFPIIEQVTCCRALPPHLPSN